MKKILAFLLAVSMILAMAACAAAPAQTTTETAQTEQTEQTDRPPRQSPPQRSPLPSPQLRLRKKTSPRPRRSSRKPKA